MIQSYCTIPEKNMSFVSLFDEKSQGLEDFKTREL